jgi:hypothetical protein
MTLNATFDSVFNIFSTDGGIVPSIKLQGVYLDFQTYKLDLAKTEQRLLHFDIHSIYIAGGFVKTGQTDFTQTISIPGSLMCLFYCFLPNDSSKTTDYNAWNNSTVRYHSLQSMSNKLYPTNPNYDTNVNNPTIGTNRHYNEYLSAINKLCPNTDLYITYERYVSSYRFYTISTYNHNMTSGSYTLRIEQATGAPDDLKVLIFGLYIPTEYYKIGEHVRITN